MATSRRITVQRIYMEPVLDVEDPLQGFYSVGVKLKSGGKGRKIGFILSGVRLVAVQNEIARTRIKWLPSHGFEVREEAQHAQVGPGKPNAVFMVSFDDGAPVVVQGEPELDGMTFVSQTVDLSWEKDGKLVLGLPPRMRANYSYSCTLNQRLRKIECVVG
jgi:hypothetical protein